MRQRINIPEDVLKELYFDKHLSTAKIGQILGCSRQTISNNLVYLDLQKRNASQARLKYNMRKDFDGNPEDRAYLTGFRLGDLNVYTPSERSETIVVRCHSTTKEQRELMVKLFSPYGKVTISSSKYGDNINCFLNRSFNFLLSKEDKIPEEVFLSKSTMLAFIAGYVDAEGAFQINQGKGRFALATCDKQILQDIDFLIRGYGILSIYSKIANKGDKSIGIYKFNKDVWRVNVNESKSLNSFINLIMPYIKHTKRRYDAMLVLQNLELRKSKKTI